MLPENARSPEYWKSENSKEAMFKAAESVLGLDLTEHAVVGVLFPLVDKNDLRKVIKNLWDSFLKTETDDN